MDYQIVRGITTKALIAIGVGIAAALVGFRYWIYHHPPFRLRGGEPGSATPADYGLPFEAITIASDGSRLAAWWVPAPPSHPSGKAVLICHGNRETLSGWAGPVAYLHGAGHAFLVFDYSGFGASTGRATPRRLGRDCRAAFAELRGWATAQTELYMLGYSLGTGVLLESLAREGPETAGTILVSPHADMRTLILHSRDNEVVPASAVRALAEAAGKGAVLREITGWSHGDFFRRPDSAYWDVVPEFIG
ncbi:alpha/beta hydrolase [Thiohalorhabdus sp.]|uniref:alpha/beta hydrolase n=1 Tax=Thiohalorhabdus sp. TaxID=3094134 RepID=UPI002FC2AFC9